MLRQVQQGFSHSTVLFLIQEGISCDRCYFHSLCHLAVKGLRIAHSGINLALVNTRIRSVYNRTAEVCSTSRIAVASLYPSAPCSETRSECLVMIPHFVLPNWFHIPMSSYLLPRPFLG